MSVALAPVATPQEVAQPPRVLVAVLAGRTKIGVALDAGASIAVQLSPLLDVINSRLEKLGEQPLVAGKRGHWALCKVDGEELKPARSLTEQGVLDGGRLWLRFIADTESRVSVIEHVTTAVAVELTKRWSGVTPEWATRVGGAMVVAGALSATGLLAAWRYLYVCWWPSVVCGLLGIGLIIAALIIAVRGSARGLADTLLLTGCGAAAVAVAAAVPGPVGAPHAAMGSTAAVIAALLVMRFTGRHLGPGTAVVVIGVAGTVIGAARMLLITSGLNLLGILLLCAVLGLHLAPTVARWSAGIKLPVFPSASGRWVFETRPDLPTTVVVASGELATLDGPESVRDIAVTADRVHQYLTGLVAGTIVLLVTACIGLCDPHGPHCWLPITVAGLAAGAALLRGRSHTDKWQATILAAVPAAVTIGVAGRYIVELWNVTTLVVGAALMVVIPVCGLVAAVVVPNRVYTPPFRKLVEWVEYLCLVGPFPLTFWLMGVFAAIRYR